MPPSTPVTDANANPEESSARWFIDDVHAHDSALRAYLSWSVPSVRNEVDDVVQETYLRIWKAGARQPLHSAKAFLFKVARHVALDILRRYRASPVSSAGNFGELTVIDGKRDVADTVSIDEKVQLLVQGLAVLPPRGREVVILRKIRCLSQKDTAVRLGLSEKTVDEHLYRAMKRLGGYLRDRGVSSYYDA